MKLCPSAAALSRSIKTMTVRYYDCFHLTRRHKPTPFANSEWTKSMTKNKSLNIQTQVLRIEDMNSFIWPEFFLFLVEWSVYDTWNLERPEFGWIRRLCKLEVGSWKLEVANCELRIASNWFIYAQIMKTRLKFCINDLLDLSNKKK